MPGRADGSSASDSAPRRPSTGSSGSSAWPCLRLPGHVLFPRPRARRTARAADLERFIEAGRPVVFIGPYEHHSNELTWREGLCTVVVVRLGPDGGIDLAHLEDLLRDPRYSGPSASLLLGGLQRHGPRISPVRELAAMLHRYGALACFDYAASAPYVRIDMNPPPGPGGQDPRLDAAFISPHKFLGGPGPSGIRSSTSGSIARTWRRRRAAAGPSPTSAAGPTISSTISKRGKRRVPPAFSRR